MKSPSLYLPELTYKVAISEKSVTICTPGMEEHSFQLIPTYVDTLQCDEAYSEQAYQAITNKSAEFLYWPPHIPWNTNICDTAGVFQS